MKRLLREPITHIALAAYSISIIRSGFSWEVATLTAFIIGMTGFSLLFKEV